MYECHLEIHDGSNALWQCVDELCKSECDIRIDFDTYEYPNIFVQKNDTNECPNIFVWNETIRISKIQIYSSHSDANAPRANIQPMRETFHLEETTLRCNLVLLQFWILAKSGKRNASLIFHCLVSWWRKHHIFVRTRVCCICRNGKESSIVNW